MTQLTVHIIDDEPALLVLLSEVVQLAGLHAKSYSRASLFFEQATQCKTESILVLDLNMPEMDGIEVMRRLAKIPFPPALILISGHDIGVLHAAEKLGLAQNLKILASLSKPLPLDKLQKLLEQHAPIVQRHLQDDLGPVKRELTAAELHQAIGDNQLTLYYQPQLEITTGRLIGVEALVRWQHPEQGLIYPDRFILLAERNGLMGELTHWVIRQVMEQKQQWGHAGQPISISVNISADNITSLALPEQIAELLAGNKLDPARLTLEVTESALMGELVTSLDILTRLRLKGIKLSIDDFGTGYSSLSQLHRVPFTELKIDRSFIAGMAEDSEAYSIVKTCILLGHELNMLVVAEGIEDQKTWALLVELGCDVAQGYYIAKPMPEDDLLEWVEALSSSA